MANTIEQSKKGFNMKDFSMPYIVIHSLLKKYHDNMINRNSNRAYELATDIVEMALMLQDLADNHENKKV
jgi:hypothetical protein